MVTGRPGRRRKPAGGSTRADVSALFAEAVRVHRDDRLDVAEDLYRRILHEKPDHAESWSNLALALLARGEPAQAAEACRRAIEAYPPYVEARLNLIAALETAGRAEEAVPVYEAALALRPDQPALVARLAAHYERQGRGDAAADLLARSAARAPAPALQAFDRARILADRGDQEGALAAYRETLDAAPDMAEALSNMGTLLAAMGRFGEAAEVSRRASERLPGNAEIANNCAVVLQQGGRTAEAADLYRRALAIDPRYAGAWANLGVALQELFRFDEAVEAFERATALKPDFHSAAVELVKLRRHICDWSRYEEDLGTLLGLLGRDTDAVFMLLLMAFPSTPQQQYDGARQHMRRLNARTAPATPRGARRAGPTRVGYLSGDYREHPVGRLIPELLAQHDRGAFEIFAYALGPDDPGRVRRRIRRACDRFVDLHGTSNVEAAARIRADDIDVLVDLTGPTTGARLDILALRPAPVQVSFLGWPGTTGADCIDYVVGDPLLTPAQHQACYSERIVQLPHCYQPSDPYRATDLPVLTRRDCGLPEDAFVFCSFNNTVKLTPDLFDLWLRLLARVPGAVLWLYCKTPRTMANLRARAEARGIAPDRIVFAPVGSMDLYLGRLRLADLFLDSFPYNAGATCNDALWMGLPVLTCAGETYVSRMAASLLHAAGLPELVTTSLEGYERLALDLARDTSSLAALRRHLAERRTAVPLFDMPRFAAALERAFAHMRWTSDSGLSPDGFAVNDVQP